MIGTPTTSGPAFTVPKHRHLDRPHVWLWVRAEAP